MDIMTSHLSLEKLAPLQQIHLVFPAGGQAGSAQQTEARFCLQVPDMSSRRDQPQATFLRDGFLLNRAGLAELLQPQPTYRGRLSGPVRTLLSIFDRWEIETNVAAILLGFRSGDLIKDLRVGTIGLDTRDTKDRARTLIKIYEGVNSLLQNAEAERSWIRAPLERMNHRSLLDVMREGSMADLLYAKSFVDYLNGR